MTFGIVDFPRFHTGYRRQIITVDAVYPTEAALIERLEALLTAKVQHIVVDSTDLVRDLTVVDVRYRTVSTAPGSIESHRSDLRRCVEQPTRIPTPRWAADMSALDISFEPMSADPPTELAATLTELPTVGLAVLQQSADLQVRRDRKYIADAGGGLGYHRRARRDELCVLDIDGRRAFAYESVYFDTPAFDSYRSSAHGRRHRFKVRTRSYLDSGGMRSRAEAARVTRRDRQAHGSPTTCGGRQHLTDARPGVPGKQRALAVRLSSACSPP